MKRNWILGLGLFALLVLVPIMVVQGQDDMDDQDERDLVDALVFMVAHDDASNGGLSADELYAIRDHVTSYYDRNILYAKQAGNMYAHLANFWHSEKEDALKTIKAASYRAWVKENGDWMYFLVDFFRNMTDPDTPGFPDPDLANTVTDGAAQAAQAGDSQQTTRNQSLLAGFNSQVQADSHTMAVTAAAISHDFARIPDAVPLIQDANSDIDLSLMITGLTTQPHANEDEVDDVDEQDPGPSGVSSQQVRFENRGSDAVTVMVESYSGMGTPPLAASTVVFPDGGSSAVLELPAGDYEFCYEWETGEDSDGDDYADMRHAGTSVYSLSGNSNSSTQSAVVVGLDPDSAASSRGRCGEILPDVPPLEQAFEGEHRYWATVVENGCDAYEFETYPKYTNHTLSFSEGFRQVQYGELTYGQEAPHSYLAVRSDGRYLILSFTETVYTLSYFLTQADINTRNNCLEFTFMLADE